MRYSDRLPKTISAINDIRKDILDEALANNYVKIVRRGQAGSPDTKIYIPSILPLNPTVPNFPQHYDKQAHVIHTNELLQEVARLTPCTYINRLLLDGQQYLEKKYTGDSLHLNSEGYEHLREMG